MKIRSTGSDAAVTRQVWLANPAVQGIVPDDDAIGWTPQGPSAPRNEFILGTMGMMPASRTGDGASSIGEPIPSANEFVRGLLAYLDVFVPV